MTHVANPYSQRLGIIRGWKSRWFSKRDQYGSKLKADILLRRYLDKRLKGMHIAEVEIERNRKEFRVIVHTSRPGMIIGRGGDGIEKLRADILKEMKRERVEFPTNFKLDIEEVANPDASAKIVGEQVKEQLEKRLPYRRVLKTMADKIIANRDVEGIRILLSGRIGGAEMARKEQIRKGGIPLQTLRGDIDFAKERAVMSYGTIGIKVWIYRGMKYAKDAHLRTYSSINEEAKN